jgi:hypothetical protein
MVVRTKPDQDNSNEYFPQSLDLSLDSLGISICGVVLREQGCPSNEDFQGALVYANQQMTARCVIALNCGNKWNYTSSSSVFPYSTWVLEQSIISD